MSGHSRTRSVESLMADARELVKEIGREQNVTSWHQKVQDLVARANEDPISIYRDFKWYPKSVVWELTLACNMRCEHCGSRAGKARDDELSLDEMYRVCDELGELGCEQVTLLGGEPLIHKNWKKVAERIRQNGYQANVITNGWTLDRPALLDDIKEVGFNIVAISVDGYAESHDRLRNKQGSFDRILGAIDMLRERDVPVAISTVITNDSLAEMDKLHKIFIDKGVSVWQLQIGSPIGRMERDNPVLIQPERLKEVYDFAIKCAENNGGILLDLADNVGYFGSCASKNLGRNRERGQIWKGCWAGILTLGIDSNGDVKGCQSHPSIPRFIQGNVRERSLIEIWNDPDLFPETRRFQRKMLSGYCAECTYGMLCKAGCTSQAFGFTGTVGDNPMCLHRVEQDKR